MAPSPLRVAFGRRLRALREEKGFSQEGFAHHVGLDRTYVSGLERGVRNPTLEVLGRVAAGLEVTLAELLDGVA